MSDKHGELALPTLGKVYVSVTGRNEIVANGLHDRPLSRARFYEIRAAAKADFLLLECLGAAQKLIA